jgi:GNAT superfamily N-acetyltransferase
MSPPSEIFQRQWTRTIGDKIYLISTDASLISHEALNEIFDAGDFDWGKCLGPQALQTMLINSLCFGIYSTTQLNQDNPSQIQHKLIGFARLMTDYVTVNYLTDVYIIRAYRGRGFGVWLMECINEVFRDMPDLRGMILITQRGSKTEGFYRKYLGMGDLADDGFCMDRKGKGAA